MAKRESIWKANDGTEHRSKQSAAVADAEYDLRLFVEAHGSDLVESNPTHYVSATAIIVNAQHFAELIGDLIKARAALAKHEAKGEK